MNSISKEVDAVVERLVATSVRRPYGGLGIRQFLLPFADDQNATASGFLLAPRAPFYVLFLAAMR